jgi:hypothetical protein
VKILYVSRDNNNEKLIIHKISRIILSKKVLFDSKRNKKDAFNNKKYI